MANEVVRNGEALPADFTLRSTRHENAGATEFESQAKYRIRERVEDERAVRRNHGRSRSWFKRAKLSCHHERRFAPFERLPSVTHLTLPDHTRSRRSLA